MPLNLSVSDSDFIPFFQVQRQSGEFYVRPEGASADVEIIRPVLAFDMANIRTGWLFYAEGTGPEKVWDPSSSQTAPRPPGPRKFKRGFEVMVYGNSIIAGTTQKIGLREFSSTAISAITAMLHMYDDYEAGLAVNPNAVPVFACEGVEPINGAFGVNYEPTFVLKSWVPRSRVPAFDEHANAAPAYSAQAKSESPTDGFEDDIPF
jgi:hypothetical protein